MGVNYIISKLVTLGTNYVDCLCILLSYGVSSKLEHLIHYLKLYLPAEKSAAVSSNWQNRNEKQANIEWPMVYMDLIKIRELAAKTSAFISPLILTSLFSNVFNVLTTVSSTPENPSATDRSIDQGIQDSTPEPTDEDNGRFFGALSRYVNKLKGF
ncbi:unnamed protein product [Orchesella dallaii]|uniref:Uncharacterized protein n=1 Tax=Orchesella dallaii TaxID=48710 RepID=A0ABP1PV38_9HEXA